MSVSSRSAAHALAWLGLAALAGVVAGAASCGGGGSGAKACTTVLPAICHTVTADCLIVPSPAGTPAGDPTPGDCHKLVCDAAGNAVNTVDDSDLPASAVCTLPATCSAGIASHPFQDAGAACIGGVCDGSGNCVACNVSADCPGTDSACHARTCLAHLCGTENTAARTTCGTAQLCDGAGSCVGCIAASDCPGIDTACATRTCLASVCGTTSAPVGTGCGGALLCDGKGGCGCSTPADCPGTDQLCNVRSCAALVCGRENLAVDTPVADQTPGDCHGLKCDGAGTAVPIVDDADLPVDGKPCTQDLCSAGVPSNPPLGSSAACPGGTCDGAGVCISSSVNGCDPATATDLTLSAAVSITFPVGLSLAYSQPCIRVKAGTVVTFSTTAPHSFTLHPLTGGVVSGLTLTPAAGGPFIPATTAGTSQPFTLSPVGTYPYYCGTHGGTFGMKGAIFVVP